MMPIGSRLVAGIDLGSTGIKVLVMDESGREVLVEQSRTPWRTGASGSAELDADALMSTVRQILERASSRLEELGVGPVAAIAISGMGETGMVVDLHCRPVAPAFAWYDPRGDRQVDAFPDPLKSEFAGRTGLPLGSQVSVAKIAYLRDNGLDLRGRRWLNLPEFVAVALGGRATLEYSLTSRTGLLDQDTAKPWPAMLAHLGIDESFLPPLLDAGVDLGASAEDLPPGFSSARLAVAGHDHLVAAEAEGIEPDEYHVSMGTAEVLLRVIDEPLGFDARTRLAKHLINEVRHVVPGKHVLVAGVKSGLIMRRALQLCGVNDRGGRNALDAAVMELPYEGELATGGIDVSGARNDDGVLRLSIQADEASPAEMFAAVLRHTNDELRVLMEAMDREVPPATASVLTGGWTGMASVVRARDRVLPHLSVSPREQETAYGAARAAARLLPATAHGGR